MKNRTIKCTLLSSCVLSALSCLTLLTGCNGGGKTSSEEGNILTGEGTQMFNTDLTNYYFDFDVKFKEEGEAGLYFKTDSSFRRGLYLYFDAKKDCVGIYECPIDKSSSIISNKGAWTKANYIGVRNATIDVDTWYKVQVYTYDKYIRVWFNDNAYDLDPYFKFDLDIGNKYGGREIYFNFGDTGIASFRNPKIQASEPIPTENTYTNYLIQSLSDPYLFLDDDNTYYLYGNNVGDSSVFYVFTSRDLVHWTKSATPIVSASYGVYGNSFRSPRVIKRNGKYFLFFNSKDGTEDYVQTYAVCDRPDGHFSNPGFKFNLGGLYIGARPIYDELTNQYYVVITYCHSGNHVALMKMNFDEYDNISIDTSSAKVLLSPSLDWEVNGAGVAEGGYIFHHNGYYYLIYTGGNYDTAYGEGYAVSTNIYGPYEKYENNPVLFATKCAWGNGDAAVTTSPDGKQFYMVYFRHASQTAVRPMNTCIDEMKFVQNPKGGADVLTVRGPSVSPQPIPEWSL